MTSYDNGTRDVERHAGRSLVPSSAAQWRYEWRITATSAVQTPTGPSTADVTRTTTAIVPVVIPTTSPASATGPLNFLYSGRHVVQELGARRSPLYVARDCTWNGRPRVEGAAVKVAVGRDLYLKTRKIKWPDGKQRPADRRDPRGEPVLVEGEPRHCTRAGPRPANWDADVFATAHDNVIPSAAVPRLPAGAHLLRAVRGAPILQPGARRSVPTTRATWVTGTTTPISGRSRPAPRGPDPADVRHGERGPGQLDQLERDAGHRDQPHARRLIHLQVEAADDLRPALLGRRPRNC